MTDHTHDDPVEAMMKSVTCSAVPVYERLGIVVRALHDTLSEIGAEAVLADVAREFPSARERLLHIASLTEKAANTVLGKVEEYGPLQDRLAQQAASLRQDWIDATGAMSTPQACESLAASTQQFLREVELGCGASHAALSDIMMAQDFQDLTGQLIKKVATLMERTENDLLTLLIDAAPAAIGQTHKVEVMAGPGAPGSIALDQDNVDDLLAELGF